MNTIAKPLTFFFIAAATFFATGGNALAAGDSASPVQHFGFTFLLFGIVLIAAKIGNFVERYGQPAVIGELLAGIALSALGYMGLGIIGDITSSYAIAFLASFGALLLLFSIGLESNLKEMQKVGARALMVALIGVVVPFSTGAFLLGPLLFPDAGTNAHLFIGAAIVATSVGITASVFRSLGISRTRAAQTVLGAAVIDDVLGLIVLAIVSAMAAGGDVTAGKVALLTAESFGFLAGALLLGTILSKPISTLFGKVYSGIGMKLGIALSFALILGFLAEKFGLEPIIGAFAAGLVLDAVHFEKFADPEIVHDLKALEFEDEKDRQKVLRLINKHKHSHVEDLIANLNLVFVPIFFVYTGLQIDIGSLLEPSLYVTAAIISIVAIAGKLLAGIAAKGNVREKLLVGMSMVPRGEVGLIFAATGKALGVLSNELFSTIILVVIITTFIAPPLITRLARPANT
jgi:Kef-type K+ transport system membrane component KefB